MVRIAWVYLLTSRSVHLYHPCSHLSKAGFPVGFSLRSLLPPLSLLRSERHTQIPHCLPQGLPTAAGIGFGFLETQGLCSWSSPVSELSPE